MDKVYVMVEKDNGRSVQVFRSFDSAVERLAIIAGGGKWEQVDETEWKFECHGITMFLFLEWVR